jgi:hypothetical protein
MPSPQYVFTGQSIRREACAQLWEKLSKMRRFYTSWRQIWLLIQVAVLHCRGHQKRNDSVTQGNQLVDEAAKMAAIKEYKENPTLTTVVTSEKLHADYSKGK